MWDNRLTKSSEPRVRHKPIPTPTKLDRPMRCRQCFYVLTGLPSNRCPECGAEFKQHDLSTFTRKTPYIWWKYWLPGATLGIVGGALIVALLYSSVGFLITLVLALSFLIGAVVGYGRKVNRILVTVLKILFLAAFVGAVVVVGLNVGSIAQGLLAGGGFAFLLFLFSIPGMAGALFGTWLRKLLLSSSFSQADYLDPWAL